MRVLTAQFPLTVLVLGLWVLFLNRRVVHKVVHKVVLVVVALAVQITAHKQAHKQEHKAERAILGLGQEAQLQLPTTLTEVLLVTLLTGDAVRLGHVVRLGRVGLVQVVVVGV